MIIRIYSIFLLFVTQIGLDEPHIPRILQLYKYSIQVFNVIL